MKFHELIVAHYGLAFAARGRALEAQDYWSKHSVKGRPDLRARTDLPAYIQVTTACETSTWAVDKCYNLTAIYDYPQQRGAFCLLVVNHNSNDDTPTVCDP